MNNVDKFCKCGGKSSGCCADITLPYGVSPNKISDKSKEQGQAGTQSTQTTK